MKKLVLIISVMLLSGCIHTGAIKSQAVIVPRGHKLIVHESQVAMENAYEKAWLSIPDKTGKEERGDYGGFFNPKTNTSHCYAPWAQDCIAHENLHLLAKYGLQIDDPHFQINGKIRTIITRRSK